jgi:hypothetical protein
MIYILIIFLKYYKYNQFLIFIKITYISYFGHLNIIITPQTESLCEQNDFSFK